MNKCENMTKDNPHEKQDILQPGNFMPKTGAEPKGPRSKRNNLTKNSRRQMKTLPSSGASSGSSCADDARQQNATGHVPRYRSNYHQHGPTDCSKKGGHAKSTDMKSFVDLKTREERAKLLEAVYAGNEEVVKQLVRQDGCNSNFVDEDDPLQPTPLMIAVQTGQVKAVKYLLRGKPHRANVNTENQIGQRAVWLAALKGDAEVAELLISDSKDKCEVNYVDQQSGMTPLYRAVMSKSPAICRILIHAGADVNMRRLGVQGKSDEGETPLIKAVQLGSMGVCEVLVNSLVDLNAKTPSGFTALHYAVACRRYKIAHYLLSERIKINARAKHGITAMTLAVVEDLAAMVGILIEYGYSIDRRYHWGETPLEMALRVHAEECALMMLNWGCSWRHKDPNKPSYFHVACHEGLCTVTRYLVEVHPQFLQEPWLREEPQQQQLPAALQGKPEFYRWLLEASRDPFSLKDLCRARILRVLGKYPANKADKLPLPETVIEGLKLKQYFIGDKRTERKYRKKSLYTKECPFDCGAKCSRPQCPDIEFSDSASEFEGYTDSEEGGSDKEAL